MKPVTVKPLCALLLLLLVLNLMGCASKPTLPPVAWQQLTLPPPPSLSTPLPPTSYSQTAADTIRIWQERLTGTRLMSAPSSPLGQ